jgi:hypothetical protein
MSCKCDLNDKLEAERLDVTFREPKALCEKPHHECQRNHFERCSKPHNPTCQRQHMTPEAQEKMQQLYFNAGRFAAGARDKVAIIANDALFESYDK